MLMSEKGSEKKGSGLFDLPSELQGGVNWATHAYN